jgi:hypothetical protein
MQINAKLCKQKTVQTKNCANKKTVQKIFKKIKISYIIPLYQVRRAIINADWY